MHRFRRTLSTTRRVLNAAAAEQPVKPAAPAPKKKTGTKAEDDEVILNRYSRNITQPKQQGASQAMLYATDGVKTEADLQKPMIGVGSVWYEGNPCNKHLLEMGVTVKKSLFASDLIGYQFGTVGVSDGISMGTAGMRYSLPSRDLIADSIESVVGGHWLDGVVVIPGCDKNMPGVLMGVARLNRPAIMVYGGTIRAGRCPGPAPSPNEPLDIVSAFQAYGKYLAAGQTEEAEAERLATIRHACPGPGACGGMYTANTMAINAEVLGMTLPGSSSYPADSTQKRNECAQVGATMRALLEKNLRPRDIMTKAAFENAITMTMVLGGSTNAVLHLIAMAANAGVKLELSDFERISDKTPVLADLRPSGKYVMEDIHKLGGVPKIMHFLLENKMLHGDTMTVTGKTLGENVDEWVHKHGTLGTTQDIIRPLNNPIKATGHIRVLRGNLAPSGAISKITGKEGLEFEGRARVYNSEDEFIKDFERGTYKAGEKIVVVLRYLGPRGGPGMPEMLKPTSLIMGAGLGKDVAFVTDGRFSGGSHGFVVGHVTPEAIAGGRIGLVNTGDRIKIDAVNNTITHMVSRETMANRKRFVPQRDGLTGGWLKLYSMNVADASNGCTLGIRKDMRDRVVDFKEPAFAQRWKKQSKIDDAAALNRVLMQARNKVQKAQRRKDYPKELVQKALDELNELEQQAELKRKKKRVAQVTPAAEQ